MGVHALDVQVMNAVLQTPPLPSHHIAMFATHIRHHVVLVNQDTTIQEGYVWRLNQGMEGVLLV